MNSQRTVLISEDEKSIRLALVDILASNHFQTLEAADGKEGVRVALSQHPDLILLDLVMPQMDGMTAFKEIRKDAWGARVPVIILTNVTATDEHLVEDIVTHKPTHYLIKADWKLQDVLKKIEDVLSQDSSQ